MFLDFGIMVAVLLALAERDIGGDLGEQCREPRSRWQRVSTGNSGVIEARHDGEPWLGGEGFDGRTLAGLLSFSPPTLAALAGRAAADAIRKGYGPLFARNEYAHTLTEPDLKTLVADETGQDHDAGAVSMIARCFLALKEFADFTGGGSKVIAPVAEVEPEEETERKPLRRDGELGLNLSYTINLNLPATSDIAVFNAIFKSLREHLLKG